MVPKLRDTKNISIKQDAYPTLSYKLYIMVCRYVFFICLYIMHASTRLRVCMSVYIYVHACMVMYIYVLFGTFHCSG